MTYPRATILISGVLACIMAAGRASQAATLKETLDRDGFALASLHYTIGSKKQAYTDADIVTELSLAASIGEFEPVTLTVLAGKDLKNVTVRVSDLVSGTGGTIPGKAFEIRNQTVKRTGSGQALVNRTLLYRTLKPIAVKAGENARFWLTVHVPGSATPGAYSGTVTVSGDGIHSELPITLRVYSFRHGHLPNRHALMIGIPDKPAYYRDCADHGMTAICSGVGGRIEVTGDGLLRAPGLERNLKMAKKAGLGDIYIAYAPPLIPTSKVKNSSHILEYHDYKHPQRMKKLALEYRDFCKKNNLPEVIWYIFDEPGRGDEKQLGPLRNDTCRNIYTQVNELPGVRTFLTMGLEEAESFGSQISIHCYGGAPSDKAVELSHKQGAQVWRYSNGISMGVNPLYSRYAMGFFPWGRGYEGSTSWTYPDAGMGEDGKPIPADVWEAIREGVDDWYYILTLEKLIKKANASGNAAAGVQAVDAQTFLDKLKASIAPSERKSPFKTGRQMDVARATIADYIERIMKTLK